ELDHTAPCEPRPGRSRGTEPALETIERGHVPIGARAATQPRRQLLDDERDLADDRGIAMRRATDAHHDHAGRPDAGAHLHRIDADDDQEITLREQRMPGGEQAEGEWM